MPDDNPYAPPSLEAPTAANAGDVFDNPPPPYVPPTERTIMRRYFAASLDNPLAMILGISVAKQIPNDAQVAQLLAAVVAYLAYFFVPESLTGRTLGKYMFGLVVVRADGHRAGWRAALIRTLTRFIEVNPFLFGGLPAAVVALVSKGHRRIGDRLAGTYVILAQNMERP